MKTSSFKKILKSIDGLNTQQDRILREQLSLKASKKKVSLSLETPYPEIRCPHCRGVDLQRWGKRNDLQRYRCKACNKTFNSLTGTPLAHLRRKGHWLDYAQCLKEGLSIRKAAALCDISNNTSFRWRHRFLQKAKEIKPEHLEGIVEADETYFLKSEKGSRKLKRPARKRGGKLSKSGINKERICVFVSRDRNKNTFDAIFERLTSNNLTAVFHEHLGKDALFCSDSKPVYRKFTRESNIRHGYINLSKGERVKKDIVHIQNANAYHIRLKDWIIYHFRGVATKYMDNYLAWFRELDEFNSLISSQTILLRAKSGGTYKLQPFMVTEP
ncbi:MAG: IS1595 family transposase [Bacteroidales bacterium]|nr:IS1595 family transposase [Bacteroidales bacterium]